MPFLSPNQQRQSTEGTQPAGDVSHKPGGRLPLYQRSLVLQQKRLHWYGHVLQKDDDWVKKCMEYEVEGPRPTGRPKKTWKEVVCEDCQARKLNTEDAMDRCKWRKLIKDVR